MSLATTDSNLPAVLGRKELDTLRRTIAHDLNDSEFELFAAICRRTGLDPIARQIYAVKRWDGRQKREVMQVQTSIDGFRVIAQRSGIYAGPATTYWCGPDGKWVDVWLAGEPPAAAKAGVYRKDFAEPVYAVAKFESYCARNKDGSLQNLWRTMPEVMIAKCAEALAIRKAFPNDVAGVYTREEMAQANNVRVTVQRPSAPPLPAEVSGGGEPTGPTPPATAPSPGATEPGGEPPAPPATSTAIDVGVVEQPSLAHGDAPAGPDIAATPSSRKRGGSGGDHGAGPNVSSRDEGPHDANVQAAPAEGTLPAPKDPYNRLAGHIAHTTMTPGRTIRRAREVGTEELGLQVLPRSFHDLAKPEYGPICQFLCDEWDVSEDADFVPMSADDNKAMHAWWSKNGGDDARKAWLSELTGGRTSSKELYGREVLRVLEHIGKAS